MLTAYEGWCFGQQQGIELQPVFFVSCQRALSVGCGVEGLVLSSRFYEENVRPILMLCLRLINPGPSLSPFLLFSVVLPPPLPLSATSKTTHYHPRYALLGAESRVSDTDTSAAATALVLR